MHRESVTRCPMFVPGRIMHVSERPIFESRCVSCFIDFDTRIVI